VESIERRPRWIREPKCAYSVVKPESGIPKLLGSLTGSLDSFGHEVTVQTFGIVMDSVIYFAKYPGLRRNILGRLGWIRNLQIGLRDYENKLFVSEYRREE